MEIVEHQAQNTVGAVEARGNAGDLGCKLYGLVVDCNASDRDDVRSVVAIGPHVPGVEDAPKRTRDILEGRALRRIKERVAGGLVGGHRSAVDPAAGS